MLTLYGIKSCDSVRKARKWLTDNNVDYRFHDFREHGLTQRQLQSWLQQAEWQQLFNKQSTSFRQLSDEQKCDINQAAATRLMLEYPTLIKRPIIKFSGQLFIGFSEKICRALTHSISTQNN